MNNYVQTFKLSMRNWRVRAAIQQTKDALNYLENILIFNPNFESHTREIEELHDKIHAIESYANSHAIAAYFDSTSN